MSAALAPQFRAVQAEVHAVAVGGLAVLVRRRLLCRQIGNAPDPIEDAAALDLVVEALGLLARFPTALAMAERADQGPTLH